MKEKYQISFSGGRTSAYMTKLLIDNFSHDYDFIVTFANTGLEHEKTLEFVNNCDKYFGFNTVWLEADVKHGERLSTQHKIVSFETASRNGEPFHEMIKKYGIPNLSYLHCTRELKLNVMQSYLKSIGVYHKDILTAIGIREDETRRVNKKANDVKITYPLIDLFPSDKRDVLDFWKKQDFDLDLDEWDGNCKLCFKKSFRKLFKQLDSDPSLIEFQIEMESKYNQVGNKEYINVTNDHGDIISTIPVPDRVFFRGQTSALKLQQMWKSNTDDTPEHHLDGGCSESCEVYSTQ